MNKLWSLCMNIVVMPILCLLCSTLTRADDPPASSLAFVSNDSVVAQARQLLGEGKYAEAEVLLLSSSDGPTSEATLARAELRELIRRMRFEYSLEPDGLLDKLRKLIPDVTREEMERWATESKARFQVIDGQKFYFRREPQNIFLFSKEAIDRRAKAGKAPPPPSWKLVPHLEEIVREAERTGQLMVLPKKHRVTHTISIKRNAPGIKPGAIVRVWSPYAQEYRQQQSVKLLSATPEPIVIAPSAIDGMPPSGALQRTVYFEKIVTDVNEPLVFREVFEYTSYAYYPNLDEALARPLPSDWNQLDLNERLPHIHFTEDIRRQVASIVGDESNPLAKAKKIFRWVSANVPWNAEDEYCIIPSLAAKGYTDRCGDCGVQNTVFITMCRIAGIPARWQSGFETKPGENWGMHDWAEIYIAPWGWLPADASYGVQPSNDPKIADFYCGHQDSYRLIVNLDWGRQLHPPKHSLRSEPADFQRGEVEVDGVNLYFDQWESKTEVER